MTCHRIQPAGAVDALRRGESPEDVFGRWGYELGTGELGRCSRRQSTTENVDPGLESTSRILMFCDNVRRLTRELVSID